MRKIMIGVMGPGDLATNNDLEFAYQLGSLIAQQGWVLLTGGRASGVMEAASKGAKSQGGITVGILQGNDTQGVSDAVDIAIVTDLGNARNNINVLSSDVVIACGMGAGTASEIALAIKNSKKVILLTNNIVANQFFLDLAPHNVILAHHPIDAIKLVKRLV